MKKLLLLLALVISIISNAQTKFNGHADIFTLVDEKVVYTDVFNVDSTSKEELFSRAKLWFVDTYKSGKDVLQLEDLNNGLVVGKGYFTAYHKSFWGTTGAQVWSKITISVKENKYKVDITDIMISFGNEALANVNIEYYFTQGLSYDSTHRFLLDIDLQFKSLIDVLKTAMGKSKADW